VIAYLGGVQGEAGWHHLAEKAQEYVSFIVLLGLFFVITGGIPSAVTQGTQHLFELRPAG
jgi:hypothetical protein